MSDISTITRMREERAQRISEMRGMIDAADEAARDFTAEENAEYEKREADVSRLDAEIERRERFARIKPNPALADEANTKIVDDGVPESRSDVGVGSAEYRSAWIEYMRRGEHRMGAEEQRALAIGTNTAGGFTVPRSFYNEIVKALRQFGVVRNLAFNLVTDGGNPLDIPRSNAFGTSGWTAENTAFTQSDPSFTQQTLSAWKGTHLALVPEELLADTGVDLEGYLGGIMGENLGVLQNTAFVVGDGSSKPTGICDPTNGATIGFTATAATSQVTAIAADSLFDTYHSLGVPYRANASWLMHDTSAKIIRKLKDTTNQYLWQPGLAAGAPHTLFGRPVFVDPDVPVMAANARSLVFGDIKRGYWVRVAGGIAVQRLNERYADTGQVGFRIFERVDGKIVDTNAIRLFQNAAT